MHLKPTIAILFALVFVAKFLVMDSKILLTIMDSTEVAYVNPFCKKHHSQMKADGQELFSVDTESFVGSVDSICNAPFKFEVLQWEYKVLAKEPQHYAYHSPSMPESSRDRFYPPPRA